MDSKSHYTQTNHPSTTTTRRRRNDNTPVMSPIILNENDMQIDDPHVNQNTQKTSQYTTPNTGTPLEESMSLDKLSRLLDTKLDKMKQDIVSQIITNLQNQISTEIAKLKLDFTGHMELLQTEQNSMKENISDLSNKISYLENEKAKLQAQIQYLENQNCTQKNENTTDTSKKIVLYGLTSNSHRHDERDIHNKVVNIFYDILNINLEGYIEEFYFVGKPNYRRPLVIELISKRMTKYILQHAPYFKNSGFYISEYLSKQALYDRKEQHQQLKSARLSGKHAVIRKNRLYVDGKLIDTRSPQGQYKIPESHRNNTETQNRLSESNITLSNTQSQSPSTSSRRTTFRQ